jgi:hypothetical protein
MMAAPHGLLSFFNISTYTHLFIDKGLQVTLISILLMALPAIVLRPSSGLSVAIAVVSIAPTSPEEENLENTISAKQPRTRSTNTVAGAAVALAKTLIRYIKPGPSGTASNSPYTTCELTAGPSGGSGYLKSRQEKGRDVRIGGGVLSL